MYKKITKAFFFACALVRRVSPHYSFIFLVRTAEKNIKNVFFALPFRERTQSDASSARCKKTGKIRKILKRCIFFTLLCRSSGYSRESLLEHTWFSFSRMNFLAKSWSMTPWNSGSLSAAQPTPRGHANTCVSSGFFGNTKVVFFVDFVAFAFQTASP